MTTTPSSIRLTADSPAYSTYAPSTASGRAAGDPEHRVGRVLVDRDGVARPGESPGAQEDEVVGARAEHDVLRLDAGIPGDRRPEVGIAAVRVGVDLGKR